MTDPMQTERWVRLADSEWVNIVNAPSVLDPFKDKEEAVREAVKLTEAKLRELNASELRSLRDALALAKSRIAELEGKADLWNLIESMWSFPGQRLGDLVKRIATERASGEKQ